MDIPVDLLRTFVMVAKVGRITKAAEQLYRTQPAISFQMKRLESLLDRRLFTRTKKGIFLSAQGERLLEHALRVLRACDDLGVGMGLTGKEAKRVRMGIPDLYTGALLPRILLGFYQKYPDITLSIVNDTSSQLVSKFEEYGLDISIVAVPCNDRAILDGSQGYIPLGQEQTFWVKGNGTVLPDMPPSYGEESLVRPRSKGRESGEEILPPVVGAQAGISPDPFSKDWQGAALFHNPQGLPLALFPEGCTLRQVALATLDRHHIAWYEAVTSLSSMSVFSSVTAGNMIAPMVESFMSHIEGLERIEKKLPILPPLDIMLTYRSTPGSEAVLYLKDHIQALFKVDQRGGG